MARVEDVLSELGVTADEFREAEPQHVCLHPPEDFGGGLRFQAAFRLTSPNLVTDGVTGSDGDHTQLALEPFLTYEPPSAGLFARAGLLFALDSPLGFGFDSDKLLVVRTQVGYKF